MNCLLSESSQLAEVSAVLVTDSKWTLLREQSESDLSRPSSPNIRNASSRTFVSVLPPLHPKTTHKSQDSRLRTKRIQYEAVCTF